MERVARLERKTAETSVAVEFRVDGSGNAAIETGIGFLDHMLTLLARHGHFDLRVVAQGDLHVDDHHTVEDVGIVLGQCLREALGTKEGIQRYGWCLMPMDETLARVAIDLGGRPFLAFDAPEGIDPIGGRFPFSLVEEFFRAFAFNGLMNLHLALLSGRDGHHMAEALFKGTAKALDQATRIDERSSGKVPSTKEAL